MTITSFGHVSGMIYFSFSAKENAEMFIPLKNNFKFEFLIKKSIEVLKFNNPCKEETPFLLSRDLSQK